MVTYRPAAERGLTRSNWLRSYHSFSFNTYFDPRHMQFGPLRVLNDDYVDAGAGFPMHAHRDMEILTWVVEGTLEHRDSTGGQGIIRPGELQRMTAGRGVRHSEFNHSQDESLRLLQIWILPDENGLDASYEQQSFDPSLWHNSFYELASGAGGEGSITINQDVRMFIVQLDQGIEASRGLSQERGAYVFTIDGSLTVNGQPVTTGDAVMLEREREIRIQSETGGSVLLFDLPL
ncbi:MAG: pirin family protein [Bacteroidia bacterium]|nr:pirin family protein [Bacteroidia bacterium]